MAAAELLRVPCLRPEAATASRNCHQAMVSEAVRSPAWPATAPSAACSIAKTAGAPRARRRSSRGRRRTAAAQARRSIVSTCDAARRRCLRRGSSSRPFSEPERALPEIASRLSVAIARAFSARIRGGFGQPLAELLRGGDVAGHHLVDRGVGRRGGHQAGRRADVVDVVARGGLGCWPACMPVPTQTMPCCCDRVMK